MEYDIRLKPRAVKDLAALEERERKRIVAALEKLQDNLLGDVKRLTNFTPEYRLRVGDFRVLFETEGDAIFVYRIRSRKDAYR